MLVVHEVSHHCRIYRRSIGHTAIEFVTRTFRRSAEWKQYARARHFITSCKTRMICMLQQKQAIFQQQQHRWLRLGNISSVIVAFVAQLSLTDIIMVRTYSS